MKKISTIQSVKVLFVAVMLVFSVGASAQNNYSVLPPAPPGVPSVSNNALGPINVGSDSQAKAGGLGIGGMVTVGTATPASLPARSLTVYNLGGVGVRPLCVDVNGTLTVTSCVTSGGTIVPNGTLQGQTLRWNVPRTGPASWVLSNTITNDNLNATITGNTNINTTGTSNTSIGNTTGTTTLTGPVKLNAFTNKKLCTDPNGLIWECPPVNGTPNGEPGGGLPTGTMWQTLHYNGTSGINKWEGSDILTEDMNSATSNGDFNVKPGPNNPGNLTVAWTSKLNGDTTVGNATDPVPAKLTVQGTSTLRGETTIGNVDDPVVAKLVANGNVHVGITGSSDSNSGSLWVHGLNTDSIRADIFAGTGNRLLCATSYGALTTSGCTGGGGSSTLPTSHIGDILYNPTGLANGWIPTSDIKINGAGSSTGNPSDGFNAFAGGFSRSGGTGDEYNPDLYNTNSVTPTNYLVLAGKKIGGGAVKIAGDLNIGSSSSAFSHTLKAYGDILAYGQLKLTNITAPSVLCTSGTNGQVGACLPSSIPSLPTGSTDKTLRWNSVIPGWDTSGVILQSDTQATIGAVAGVVASGDLVVHRNTTLGSAGTTLAAQTTINGNLNLVGIQNASDGLCTVAGIVQACPARTNGLIGNGLPDGLLVNNTLRWTGATTGWVPTSTLQTSTTGINVTGNATISSLQNTAPRLDIVCINNSGTLVNCYDSSIHGSHPFTTSGRSLFIVPSGIRQINVVSVGGGGHGGNGGTTIQSSGGGGGGGGQSSGFMAVFPGQMLSVLVGRGGANNGDSGGSSYIEGGSFMARGGGAGGDSVSAAGVGGKGGTGFSDTGDTDGYDGGIGVYHGTGSSSQGGNSGSGTGGPGKGGNGGAYPSGQGSVGTDGIVTISW